MFPPRTFFSVFLSGAMAILLFSCRTIDDDTVESEIFDQAAFAKADLDSDGKMSEEELAKYKHREALAEFDLNDDQVISSQEWSMTNLTPGETSSHFKLLDKNGDGRVLEEEAVRFITEHENFGDTFQKLDQDGDRYLLWEEFEAGDPNSINFTLFSSDENEASLAQ